MKPKVQFLFDFGSPNAYFAHKVIPAVEQRTGVKFEYVPILLGGIFKLTGNRSPAEAFAGIIKRHDARVLSDRRLPFPASAFALIGNMNGNIASCWKAEQCSVLSALSVFLRPRREGKER